MFGYTDRVQTQMIWLLEFYYCWVISLKLGRDFWYALQLFYPLPLLTEQIHSTSEMM